MIKNKEKSVLTIVMMPFLTAKITVYYEAGSVLSAFNASFLLNT